MRKASKHFCLTTISSSLLLVSLLGVGLISRSEAVVPKDPFLGIPPQDEMYYKVSSDTIKCRDGSKTFSKAQLNDDYCDCLDGSDEPGTAACPRGKFYCQNAGYAPVQLFSSRVNDGICDCCDGSDEYSGEVKCPNTCWEAGKVARGKLKKKIATYKEGVTLRKRDVEQAKLQFAKDEAELSKLKKEELILKGLVQQLKVRKEQIDKAEEEERLRKEKEEKGKKAAEEKTVKEEQSLDSDHDDIVGTLDDPHPDQGEDVEHENSNAENEHTDDSKLNVSPPNEWKQEEAKEEKEALLPHNQDDSVVPSEADQATLTEVSPDPSSKGEDDPAEKTEELSKEELGRLVASRWTGNTEKQSTGEDDANANDHENQEDPEETPHYTHNDEYDGYASETDDGTGKYDDSDVEEDTDDSYGDNNNNNDAASSYQSDTNEEDFSVLDITSPSNPSWLEKIKQTVRNILQKVNLFQTPVDLSDAARVRKEYEESSSKFSQIQSRISSLTQKLAQDFGVDKEFYSFYDKCFEGRQNKYVYKICPFKQASQIEDHSTTRLGKWGKFEDSYSVMIFSNGDKCWNGPDRSLKVKLRCGLKNDVTDVDEPSRCEYLALLSTPILCLDEKLKELEDKLESMNKERPKGHDEL